MIGLEQWRAAIGGWYSGNMSAIYRHYGSRRIVRNWPKLLLILDNYTAAIYYSVYWLIVVLFALMSQDGLFVAFSLAFDSNSGYPQDLCMLVKSPTATVFQVSHDSLQRFRMFVEPTVDPVLRTCTVHLRHSWKLANPSAASMLRLLLALNWLLIVAGDVELNPGPVPPGITELLPTVDASVLTEEDLGDVIDEVESLAGRWESMCIRLGLLSSDKEAIAKEYHHNSMDCLREMLAKWLKMSYNTQKHGPPSWRKMVAAVANSTGGDNPALAKAIAENHQGTAQTAREIDKTQSTKRSGGPSSMIAVHAQYLQSRYQIQIPAFFALQWPPPPTQKVLHLAMIQGKSIKYGSIDEKMVRLTLQGKIYDILYQKTPVELKDIFRMDNAKRKVILIEGAPGAGKSTLAWYICQQWGAGKLFPNFRTVIFIQLRDPAIQSAKSVEDILPAESRSQAERVVTEFKACRGQGVLFVMDGWDELPVDLHADSIFYQIIASPEKLNLHHSTVIITSRPIASGDLYRCRTISSRIQILGFTPTEVKGYFREALDGDSTAVQKLQDQLRERPMIEASCYLPLNAAIVAHLFLACDHSLPTTLHGVFTSLVLCCLIRHMTKQGKKIQADISSLDNLPPHLQEPLKNISTLAYHGVMENKATFSEMDLKLFKLPQELGTLGLLQGVESFKAFKSSVTYNFLHLSVQELLASLYISRLPEHEQVVIFKKLFGQPRFALVFRFYAAFTGLETKGIRKIVGDISKAQDTSQLLHLFGGLYEAQNPSLCQFVGSQLGGRLDLQSTLSPVDCLTVGYVISCISLTCSGEFKADLSNCSLADYRVSFLAKGLCDCSSAERMHTHHSPSRDTGVSSRCGLHLNLKNNQISHEGAGAIAEALKVNQSLTTLDLWDNQISHEGAGAIAEALKVNRSLTTLRLGDNEIADTGAEALAEGLQQNNSLQELHLTRNQISHEGAGTIAEALKVNQSLTTLDRRWS